MLFGTAAHEVLQGRDPELAARKYCLPASSAADLAKIKERFFASKGRSNDIVYRELKFTADVDGQRFQGKVDRLETTSSGRSNVIDFKTDAVKQDNEEKDAQKHADQLRAYSLMMVKALHGKVQGQVYFTGSGKYVNIGEEAGFETGLNKKIKKCSEGVKSSSGNAESAQHS
jgi:RecB family exonuclease